MYEFKMLPEAIRAAGFAALVFGLQLLVAFNVEDVIGDWESYVKAAGSGLLAAAAAAALAAFTRRNGG